MSDVTRELLAAVKKAQGIPSDYRLARVLGVTDNTVGNWQHGRRRPDDETAVKLAELAGRDPAEVLVSLYAERAEGSMRDLWQTIAQKVHDSAHGALGALLGTAVIVSALFAASPDAAASTLTRPADQTTTRLYIMSTLRRWLRRAARLAPPNAIERRGASSVGQRANLTPQTGALQLAGA